MRRRIGAGGFATVWLCYDEQLDSPVAVKVLADNWAGDHHVRQRFVEEGRFLRKVDSPHVVPVYDFGELEDDRPFLVMAYADQGNLADRLELSMLPPAQALQVVREVGAGLTALHHRDVLHRDVKPANVLFRSIEDAAEGEPQVRAMLGDLGLGKALDMSSRLTMVGGTPAFVAPEQARGERMDARADQYSLGALTYLLLAGRPAYNHGSLHVAGDPPPLEPLGHGFPDAVDAAVRRAMAPDREDRWPDVATYVRELTRALADVTPAGAPATVGYVPPVRDLTMPGAAPSAYSVEPTAQLRSGSEPDPARRRRRWPWALAGAAALVAGLAGGWFAAEEIPAQVRVVDDNGSLAVTVPRDWDGARSTADWTPPGGDEAYSALSVGAAQNWQSRERGEPGVFLGVYSGDKLPANLPGHPECDSTQEAVPDTSDLGDMITAVSTGCPGDSVRVERVIQVANQRLLWVQVQSTDRASASAALNSVETPGF